MADRRRRRPRSDGGEDEPEAAPITKDSSTKQKELQCESEGEVGDGDAVSEYESASEDKEKGDDEDSEEEETDSEEEETETDDEEGTDDEVTVEDDGSWVEEERQSADGQEQQDEDGKKLDDDEDRKNPAYIPRRGAFYEHDTRIHGGDEEESPKKTIEEEDESHSKKKLWKENDKWLHDRYRDDQQAPKSRDELIALYGYDIRSYDKPPDSAPAPRRGGRENRGRGRRNLGDFISSNQHRENSGPTYSDYVNENESPREYSSTSKSYDRRERESPSYDSRAKNYRNQDYNNQRPDYSNRRQEYQSERQDYQSERQDYNREHKDYRPQGSRQESNNYRSSQEYRGSYGRDDRSSTSYQSDYKGRSRGNRSGGGRGRYSESSSDGSYVQSRQRQSPTPKEYTNSAYNGKGVEKPRVDVKEEANVHSKSNSPDVVISNKENVQTISVTITTTEKKSYSKDRRSKPGMRDRTSDDAEQEKDAGILQASAPRSLEGKPTVTQPQSRGVDKPINPGVPAKQEVAQSRPKRYSSQRQRGAQEVNYQDQMQPIDPNAFYTPDVVAYNTPPRFRQQEQQVTLPIPPPRIPQPPPQDPAAATFQPAILQPPMGFPIPVSTSGLPTAPPPRLFVPVPAPAPAAIIQPQFIGTGVPGVPGVTGVVYGAPPYMGFSSPPPPAPQQQVQVAVVQAPAPTTPTTTAAPPPQQQGGADLFRSGTTYYPPELQQPSPNRSPQKRTKTAIPIVKPSVSEQKRSLETLSEVSSTDQNASIDESDFRVAQYDTSQTEDSAYEDDLIDDDSNTEQLCEGGVMTQNIHEEISENVHTDIPKCSHEDISQGIHENLSEGNQEHIPVRIPEDISEDIHDDNVDLDTGGEFSSLVAKEENIEVKTEECSDIIPENMTLEKDDLSVIGPKGDNPQIDTGKDVKIESEQSVVNVGGDCPPDAGQEARTESDESFEDCRNDLDEENISLSAGSNGVASGDVDIKDCTDCPVKPDSTDCPVKSDITDCPVKPDITDCPVKPSDCSRDQAEMRKPQVQEFCVRKDLQFADIKPTVTVSEPMPNVSAGSSEYGGAKITGNKSV